MGTTHTEAMEAVYWYGVPAASRGSICVPANGKVWVSTASSVSDGSTHANLQYKWRTAVRRAPSTETAITTAAPSLTVGYSGNARTNRNKSGQKRAVLALNAVKGCNTLKIRLHLPH